MLTGKEKTRIEKSFRDFYLDKVVKILVSPMGLREYSAKRLNDLEHTEYGGNRSYSQTASENIIEEHFENFKWIILLAQEEMGHFKEKVKEIPDGIERDIAMTNDMHHSYMALRCNRPSSSKLMQLVTLEKNKEKFYFRPYDLNYLLFTSLRKNTDGSIEVILRGYQDDEENVYEKGSADVLERRLKNIRGKYPQLYNSLTCEIKGLGGHNTTVYHEGILILILKEMEERRLSRFSKKDEVIPYWNELALSFLKKLRDFSRDNGEMKRIGDLSLLKAYIEAKWKDIQSDTEAEKVIE